MNFPKTIFVIDVPYESKSFKCFYYKSLEIQEFEYNEDKNSDIYNLVAIHKIKKNSWVRTKANPTQEAFALNKINKEIVSKANRGNLAFEDFNIAKISKLILINAMKSRTNDKINKMLLSLNKGIENSEEILNKEKLHHPEYFI